MNYTEFETLLRRFDGFNDSAILSLAIDNIAASRCDVLLRISTRDSESEFALKEISVMLYNVGQLKVCKSQNRNEFFLPNGGTYIFDGCDHHLELGGNGEPKIVSEMQNEDVYVRFKSFMLVAVSEL